jgi:hypothetical protein
MTVNNPSERDAGFGFNTYWRFDENSPLRRFHEVSVFQG